MVQAGIGRFIVGRRPTAAHFVLACTFALAGAPAAAMDRMDLALPIGSYHFDRTAVRNETNPGLGLELRFGNYTVAAGSYINSHNNRSRYLNLHMTLLESGAMSSAVVLGTVDGYPFSNGDFGPMAALALKWLDRDFGMTVFLLPPVGSISGGAVAFQFQQRLR